MKRRRVVWSSDALDEIDAAVAYIGQDSPRGAGRVAVAIRRCGVALGRAATGRPSRMWGVFEKPVPRTPYVLAYVLDEADASLIILRVIHGARDWREDAWPR